MYTSNATKSTLKPFTDIRDSNEATIYRWNSEKQIALCFHFRAVQEVWSSKLKIMMSGESNSNQFDLYDVKMHEYHLHLCFEKIWKQFNLF